MQTSTDRIRSIDAFRGFALAGIAIAHMVEQYLAAIPPAELMANISVSPFDQFVDAFMFIIIRGKFYAMFSFLFGVSFFIQMNNAASKGINFRPRFLWRLALLLMIGYCHSLFYRGDILTIYALLGIVLVFFYSVRGSVCLALAAAIFLGAPRYLLFGLHGGETIIPGGDLSPGLPASIAYFDAILTGSLLDVFHANAWHGHLTKLEFQINVFGRWYQTFAYFLLGLWVGRSGLFGNTAEYRSLLKSVLRYGLVATVVLIVGMAMLFSQVQSDGPMPAFDTWTSMFALTLMDLSNLALAAAMLSAFLLIFLRPRGRAVLGKLAPYGRTALSNYVLQTLVGTAILYNWGLGLLGEISNSQTFMIALVVIAAQIMLSTLWLKHFRFGPLEWLWRSGTYLEWQRMRHRSN